MRERPDVARAAIQAVIEAQKALKQNPARATQIGKKLFPFTDPVGKELRFDGRKYEIVGVFDEKKSAFGSGYDNYVLIPISTFQSVYGMTSRDETTPLIFEDGLLTGWGEAAWTHLTGQPL